MRTEKKKKKKGKQGTQNQYQTYLRRRISIKFKVYGDKQIIYIERQIVLIEIHSKPIKY